ncbi:MAG: DUF4331 domain-containing protein [Chitinophagaceae bacterium]|nr:DUF4331 domain-containing protein [Chitinophagaceae bacterium]
MKGRLLMLSCLAVITAVLVASSHREAPLIADDPLADNTDLYAFRSPANPNKVVIIANYIPAELPQGGPNYYNFGPDVRYEIHIDNDIKTAGDDIVYRFSFQQVNEDPTTFFNIRLGKQNLKTSYSLQRSMDGGKSFTAIVTNGIVPPNNIGPRSIESPVGLDAPGYDALMRAAIANASTGERVFAGPIDDPFFVDLGGIFDLGDAPRQSGVPRDGLAKYNVHSLALEIDISTLQKKGKSVDKAKNILDDDYIIGVWASASRRKVRTLNNNVHSNTDALSSTSGEWVQVSRLGMPLTNEVIIPIGDKDYWNSLTPYQDLANLERFGNYFYNPELALYMDDSKFGGAVPAFSPLRIQPGFRNGENGLFSLRRSKPNNGGTKGSVNGTILNRPQYADLLLPGPGKPRSVDIYPIFNTGVPNEVPYQLATGKNGNPLAAGKPFINNFLPTGGDMLRLNMAVPVTPRTSADFSSLGLVWAAVLGLTDPRFNTNRNIQFIPNMDGFPNGRRLEDDVTRISLQAVSGIVLAAIGIPYDEPDRLGKVINYSTGVERNDAPFKMQFPFVAAPWRGTEVQ